MNSRLGPLQNIFRYIRSDRITRKSLFLPYSLSLISLLLISSVYLCYFEYLTIIEKYPPPRILQVRSLNKLRLRRTLLGQLGRTLPLQSHIIFISQLLRPHS
jgi:hypothetical protein